METSAASLCALLAQECWHPARRPDRQLHCSGVFNMPRQDPGASRIVGKLHPKVTGKVALSCEVAVEGWTLTLKSIIFEISIISTNSLCFGHRIRSSKCP